MESWRDFLYPLGFLAQMFFGLRFLQQWISSERKGMSSVTKWFWIFSLAGNLFLCLHSYIQFQFHVCLIQACNVVISWRNLNLMQSDDKKKQLSHVFFLFIFAIVSVLLLFGIQTLIFPEISKQWFRIPSWSFSTSGHVSLIWHLLGGVSMVLFSSRFWIQWWLAEKRLTSQLTRRFWWLSFIGGTCSICYFFRIGDSVNLIGPAIGIVPYIRNLMLIYRVKEVA